MHFKLSMELKMYKRFIITIPLVFCLCGFIFCNAQVVKAKELVTNPNFQSTGGEQLPEGWSVWKPVLDKTACRFECIDEGLMVRAAGDPYAVGGIVQQISDIKPGQAYAIKAFCQLRDVSQPYYSLLIRMTWFSGGKRLHPAGMLVRGPKLKANTAILKMCLSRRKGLIVPNCLWILSGLVTVRLFGKKLVCSQQ